MNKRRIVVMGGSFNPPTIAHLRLMQAAGDGIGAEKGIFVPSSHTYVKIKMRWLKRPKEVYSQQKCFDMLSSMCKEDPPRLTVDDFEYQEQNSRNYETMEYLQKKHPDSELYFLLGADKLHVFPRWHRGREFVKNFKLIVFERDGMDSQKMIMEDERLRTVRDVFVILPEPTGAEDISSTAVRRGMEAGEDIAHLVTPGVYEILTEGME